MGATTGNASSGNFQSQAGSDTNRMDINLGRQAQIMQMSLLASQKANIDAVFFWTSVIYLIALFTWKKWKS